jgi:adenosylhomocysteine nucleosidase
MIIGIIGAMDEEIELLIKEIENIKKHQNLMYDVYEGNYFGKTVVFLKSGIGKVNAAVATQMLIKEYGAHIIINTGIAGSLGEEVSLGDVVVSTETQQYDIDVTIFGYKEGEIPRMDTSVFKADEKIIEILRKNTEFENKLHFGKIVSGDRFVSSGEIKEKLRNVFKGLCVDMESGSIGHVCYLYSKPYVAIRCISDNADESAETIYKDFNVYAANLSAKITLDLINKI